MSRVSMAMLIVGLLAGGCGQPVEEGGGARRPEKSAEEKERIRKFWELQRQAVAAEKSRRCADAVPLFEQALALDPDHQDSLYSLGGCLAELGRFPEAVTSLRRLIEVSPGQSPRAHGLLADLHARPDPDAPLDLGQALDWAARHNALNPEESGPHLVLGELATLRGDFAAARDYLDKALGLNHTSARGTYALGLLELEAGDRAAAETLFAAAVELGKPKAAHKGVKQEGDTADKPPPLTGTALVARSYQDWSRLATGLPAGVATIAMPDDFAPRAIAAADYDRDGDLDLAAADDERGIRLYEWNGRGLVESAATRTLTQASAPARAVAWGDVDGDGRLDLWAAGSATGEGRLWLGQAGGFRLADGARGLGGARDTIVASFADLDRDGAPDLIECGAGLAPLRVFRNRGGRFESGPLPSGPAPTRPCTSVSLADADGDGAPELLATYWKLAPRYYRNDGRGQLGDATAEAGLEQPPAAAWTALLADLDGDRRPEVLIAPWNPLEIVLGPAEGGSPLRLWRGGEGGRFVAASEVLAGLGPAGAMAVVQVAAASGPGRGAELLIANGGARFDAREPLWRLRFDADPTSGLTVERERLPGEAVLPWNAVAAAVVGRGRHVALAAGGWLPRSSRRLVVVDLGAPERRLARAESAGR